MSFKKFGFIAAALSLVATSIFTLGAQAAPEPKSVYIVKFVDNASVGNEVAAAKRNGIDVTNVLEFAFKGFIGEMTAAQAKALSNNPRVDFVEADAQVYANDEQPNATWGIDRIDQAKGIDTKYSYTSTGSGVTAYVIDTGILASHTEFTGRIRTGISYVSDRHGTTDCNGHGTHVAGTIGGTTYGIAKSVTLVPVRVLNCQGSGTTSAVAAGVDWVVGQVDKNSDGIADFLAVANMSLGGGISSTIDSSVSKLAKLIPVAVAAGNSNVDACGSSPARVGNAITVGATSSTDTRATFSNYGTCLDIFAPGVSIVSASIKSTTAFTSMSGTSMASPHVAGVAARYLSWAASNPTLNLKFAPSDVAAALDVDSQKGLVVNPGVGSPNELLYRDPAK